MRWEWDGVWCGRHGVSEDERGRPVGRHVCAQDDRWVGLEKRKYIPVATRFNAILIFTTMFPCCQRTDDDNENIDVPISKGPANKRGKLFGAPNLDDESESTVSGSSTSSVGQVSSFGVTIRTFFPGRMADNMPRWPPSPSKNLLIKSNLKTLLLIREHGKCFVSDEWYEACTIAHIVPFSRQDVSRCCRCRRLHRFRCSQLFDGDMLMTFMFRSGFFLFPFDGSWWSDL
jgi:hypothetical protein